MITHIKHFFFLLCLFVFNYATSCCHQQQNQSCSLSGFAGKLPYRFSSEFDYLQRIDEFFKGTYEGTPNFRRQRAFLFDGESGVGKTYAAKLLAQKMNATLLCYNARDFADNMESPDIIHKIYVDANELVKKNNKLVFILVDDIDVIANSDPNKKSTGSLCAKFRFFDEIYGNPISIFVVTIFTTNKFKEIDDAFLSRTLPVRFYLPDKDDRKEIIKYYATQYSHNLSEQYFNWLSIATKGLTGRDFKEIFAQAAQLAHTENSAKIEKKHINKIVRDLFIQSLIFDTDGTRTYLVDCVKLGISLPIMIYLMFKFKKGCKAKPKLDDETQSSRPQLLTPNS